ncbi:hypothetical protein [Williamsoniiplasma luminosum]|uniref:Uncharacterized protein n=1 Tax=Williamsoniiplasma luminosum TaxID=214888 RepID=A0A2S0NL21_9MOLU|nr:hypothetical protein [Williamsoniiplasma luminosum]AVP49702.1 MAG: hypothetical protein C5T88_03955 [Williamsoniiplasma luminosum]
MAIKVGEIYKGWSEAHGDYYEENGKFKFARPLIIEKVYPEDKLVRVGISSTKLKTKYIFNLRVLEKKISYDFDKYETIIISENNLRKKVIDLRNYPQIYKRFENLKRFHDRNFNMNPTQVNFEKTIFTGQYKALSHEEKEYARRMEQFSPKEQAYRRKCEQDRIKLLEQIKHNKILNKGQVYLDKNKNEEEFISTEFLNEVDKILNSNKQEPEVQNLNKTRKR